MNASEIVEEGSQRRRPSILVVDDERSVRHSLRRTLLESGFSVVEASSGPEAIAIVRASLIDAVLLDLHMPGMQGDELLEHLRSVAPAVPAFLMSGALNDEISDHALELGAAACFAKPFDFDELIEALRRAVGL